jgi:hypothetical protein
LLSFITHFTPICVSSAHHFHLAFFAVLLLTTVSVPAVRAPLISVTDRGDGTYEVSFMLPATLPVSMHPSVASSAASDSAAAAGASSPSSAHQHQQHLHNQHQQQHQQHQQISQPHLALLPVALGGSPLVGHCALHIRLRGKPIAGSPFAIPMLDPAVPPPCQVHYPHIFPCTGVSPTILLASLTPQIFLEILHFQIFFQVVALIIYSLHLTFPLARTLLRARLCAPSVRPVRATGS